MLNIKSNAVRNRLKNRLDAAHELYHAALSLLQSQGQTGGHGTIVFEPPTPDCPKPRLSISMCQHPLQDRLVLSVWAILKSGHAKVLALESTTTEMQIVTFRRGEWELELLAMGRVTGVPIN